MARSGERSPWLAWTVGILSAGVVAGLVWLAIPGLPAVVGLAGDRPNGDGDSQSADGATPAECRTLYPDALWAGLSWEAGSELSQDQSAPATAATVLVESVAPQVRFTCTWTSDLGTIVTTLADAGPDAGAIAQSALPGLGYGCAPVNETRMRCTKSEGDVLETLEFGEGLWLSTVETAWHPERYSSRVAETVWDG